MLVAMGTAVFNHRRHRVGVVFGGHGVFFVRFGVAQRPGPSDAVDHWRRAFGGDCCFAGFVGEHGSSGKKTAALCAEADDRALGQAAEFFVLQRV